MRKKQLTGVFFAWVFLITFAGGARGEAFMRTSIQMQLKQLGRKETIPTDAVFGFSFAKKASAELMR